MHKNAVFVLILIIASALLMSACAQADIKVNKEDGTGETTPAAATEDLPAATVPEEESAAPSSSDQPSETLPESPATEPSTEPTTESETEPPVTTVTTTTEETTTEAPATTTVTTTEETTTELTETEPPKTEKKTEPPEEVTEETTEKVVAPPAAPDYEPVSAPGINEYRTSEAVIDYSNTDDGYIMVMFSASTSNRLKALVNGPSTQYQYDIQPGVWAALPLTDGNGTYTVGIYENVKGSSYAQVIATDISASISDEFAPFLRSNQYVDFESAPNTIEKASELCGGISDPLDKVKAIYDYVVENVAYDYDKAATVQSGYLPVLDSILKKGKGICFDYAGLMTGMLRSQGIPCKLVIGYVDTDYHAWISVWTEDDGWIESAIYFNGETWQRMDPTFASTGNRSDEAMDIINNSSYLEKYIY